MGLARSTPRQLKLLPSESDLEEAYRRQGIRFIAGVDEVGRGPLAGPVVAAAVILASDSVFPRLTDSKQLTPARREFFDRQVRDQALAFAIQEVGVPEIESLGILSASLKAMALAVQSLVLKPELVLIDGPWGLQIQVQQQPIIKGDQRCLSIAAASVLAKVYRDRQMQAIHELYPHYNFASHKGYGTREHLEAIRRWGPCPVHRRTFRGVREWCR
ncbi:ribonuclease HII [Desulfobacca acetoxidans]|uniref:Ribonuclease HII n=1 Tax=Desulfobacca acetoxidans (strain ATCC 700848 / DSM 11109 / ASRB2) TaxID=880072 RepID=F2NF72_DESAR|nr:ribonuclease HII [Desulfobacca acetoxidans]AEB08627.1 Ribonuclease H [Desulfobacca acetoxidans DSM 11109]